MEQGVAQFLPLIILFAIFYFLIIRPQQQQQKRHKAMLEGLSKGDKIVTTGGLMAEIVKVEEAFLKVKLNESVIVKVERSFISKKVEIGNENA